MALRIGIRGEEGEIRGPWRKRERERENGRELVDYNDASGLWISSICHNKSCSKKTYFNANYNIRMDVLL